MNTTKVHTKNKTNLFVSNLTIIFTCHNLILPSVHLIIPEKYFVPAGIRALHCKK